MWGGVCQSGRGRSLTLALFQGAGEGARVHLTPAFGFPSPRAERGNVEVKVSRAGMETRSTPAVIASEAKQSLALPRRSLRALRALA